jgi:ABC-type enterochelin transport system ATPase subunit
MAAGVDPIRIGTKEMLKNVKLQFGPHGSDDPLELEPGSITVFVGPNNSGKSLILREIERYIAEGNPGFRIINELAFDLPNESEIERILLNLEHDLSRSEPLQATDQVSARKFLPDGKIASKGISLERLHKAVSSNDLKYVCNNFIHLL